MCTEGRNRVLETLDPRNCHSSAPSRRHSASGGGGSSRSRPLAGEVAQGIRCQTCTWKGTSSQRSRWLYRHGSPRQGLAAVRARLHLNALHPLKTLDLNPVALGVRRCVLRGKQGIYMIYQNELLTSLSPWSSGES